MSRQVSRREFVAASAAVGVGLAISGNGFAAADKPAVLGGTPVHKGGWPKWPDWREEWEGDIVKVLRSGRWCRSGGGGQVPDFEAAWAKLLGAKRCLATASGTTALITSLFVAGVDAGDEVICSPYTFSATYNTILIQKALPVFADTDPATLTMDPASIESRITERTKAIVPVHIYGMPCEMDAINAIAKKHNLMVVEDSCQAWLAEYHGKKCGTLGDLGCFSFQNSKHIPSGEGGAVTGNSDELLDHCHSFHNCGRTVGSFHGGRGSNYRMTHMQAVMLLQQIEKLVKETEIRRANADYLSENLKKIPGITPVRLPENSRAVWHLYAFRYDPAQCNGLPRNKFMRALSAEGIPCSGGYGDLRFDGLFEEAASSRGYKRLWSPERLKAYADSFQELKGNQQVCATTIGLSQNLLLAERSNVEHIVQAVAKVQANAEALLKS